jgi:hypothetical protein
MIKIDFSDVWIGLDSSIDALSNFLNLYIGVIYKFNVLYPTFLH